MTSLVKESIDHKEVTIQEFRTWVLGNVKTISRRRHGRNSLIAARDNMYTQS